MHLIQLFALFLQMVPQVFGHNSPEHFPGAPPDIFHGYNMTDVPIDTRPYRQEVTYVPTIEGGVLDFDGKSLMHYQSGTHWWGGSSPTGGWGHHYEGSVYYRNRASLTMLFPEDTCAFIFYAQSHCGNTWHFIVTYSNGEVLEADIVSSSSEIGEAEGFGIADDDSHVFPVSVTIQTDCGSGFAVGEFSQALCPRGPCANYGELNEKECACRDSCKGKKCAAARGGGQLCLGPSVCCCADPSAGQCTAAEAPWADEESEAAAAGVFDKQTGSGSFAKAKQEQSGVSERMWAYVGVSIIGCAVVFGVVLCCVVIGYKYYKNKSEKSLEQLEEVNNDSIDAKEKSEGNNDSKSVEMCEKSEDVSKTTEVKSEV